MSSSPLSINAAGAESALDGRLSLRRNFSWTLSGNLIYALCQWAMLSVLAKAGSAEMVGQFALGLALTAPVVMFANLQLRGVQATDAIGVYSFSTYLTLRTLTTLAAIPMILLLLVIGDYERDVGIVILLVGLAKAVDAMSDVYYGMFQRREQMDLIAKALVLNGILGLSLLALGLGLTQNLVVGAVGFVVASCLTLVLYVVPTGRRVLGGESFLFHLAFERSILYSLFRMALPLGIVMLLISLIANIPRYFIESTEGQSQLGIFAALSYLIVAGNTMVAALGQSASPRLAIMYANGHVAQFRNAVYKLMLSGLAAGVVGAIIALAYGETIITTMYSDEYAQHTSLLFTLALAGGISFAGSFVGYGVTAARHFDVQVPVFLIVGLVCLGASAVLVPTFGILGGALSILVASLVQLCASVLVIHRATRNGSSAHD